MKNLKKKMIRSSFFVLFLALFNQGALGITKKDIMFPTHFAANFLHGICLAMGIGLVITGIVKYTEYRRHRNTGFSLIFFLILTGLALIGVGLLPNPKANA